MRLIVDMNLSPRWVDFLQARGFEARHWSALGPIEAPDTHIMEFARANDYAVLTHDLDFGDILAATGGRKPSVVQIRAGNLSLEQIGSLVAAAIAQALRIGRNFLLDGAAACPAQAGPRWRCDSGVEH